MVELIEQAQDRKRLARAHRDAGDTAAAVAVLRHGIDALESALTSSQEDANGSADAGEAETAIAVQLADLYGMLGGTLRQQGDQLAAAAAYDAGFRFEADPRYAIPSTYNALNRLVTRILLRPDCLADPGLLRQERELEFVDVRHEFGELHARLHREVAGARAGDFWAAGDLSLTCALSGDEPGMRQGLEEFARLSPPPAVRDAYRDSIGALARLDTPRKDDLRTAETAWSR
jgi:hypothetical protein